MRWQYVGDNIAKMHFPGLCFYYLQIDFRSVYCNEFVSNGVAFKMTVQFWWISFDQNRGILHKVVELSYFTYTFYTLLITLIFKEISV